MASQAKQLIILNNKYWNFIYNYANHNLKWYKSIEIYKKIPYMIKLISLR